MKGQGPTQGNQNDDRVMTQELQAYCAGSWMMQRTLPGWMIQQS